MPIEIRVGPPTITISQGRTFMVTSPQGEIEAGTPQGLYAFDTRFISFYHLYLNRMPLELIDSSQISFSAACIHLTNPEIQTQDGKLEAHTIHMSLARVVGETIREQIEVTNYSDRPVTLLLELALRSDFADLFEVKTGQIPLRGAMDTTWDAEQRCLHTRYVNRDFHRGVTYRLLSHVDVGYANGRLFLEIKLDQNEHWHTDNEIVLEHGHPICHLPAPISGQELSGTLDERQVRWQQHCTKVATSNDTFLRMYHQAVEDMGALRLYDLDVSDDAWVPAAGVPWFVSLFGRDSLIASYQTVIVAAGFGRGTLKHLAHYQATERDDWRDAQPGKIMHEIRFGELAHFHLKPFTPYYGTADATMLYVILLSEIYRWTGDVDLLTTYRDVAGKCLAWIDHFGDLDGDGFQEYQTFSTDGYENLSWKDSSDAVVYPDGSQVKQPKGLCELQGYVYDAKIRMAEVFSVLGDEAKATALREQAESLKRRFNQTFWLEDEGCYAFGLDPNKQPIRSIASNAGRCLWSGIADPDKARRTAKRLLQENMWSGWGIRTLSSTNPAYNPLAYQRGSIWPHDNAMIAAGFKRYGLIEEANQVIGGMFDAIEHFDAYRPPEVFAGIRRKEKLDFPVLYPKGANIPQAWSTGSIFHLLRVILGLRADAPHKRLYVQPTLPAWLPEIALKDLHIGSCSLSLRFWREGKTSHWEIDEIKSDKQENEIHILNETESCDLSMTPGE
jgi:glycogen debranching enzyme